MAVIKHCSTDLHPPVGTVSSPSGTFQEFTPDRNVSKQGRGRICKEARDGSGAERQQARLHLGLFFFTRELSWTELMLHKYRQSVLTRKHKQISNGASLPYKICREQLTFDLWTPQFLHVSPFLCGDG